MATGSRKRVLAIPAGLEDLFDQVHAHLGRIAVNELDGLPMLAGVPRDIELAYDYFGWLFDAENTIGDLRLLISDLDRLPSTRPLDQDSTRRYFLLIRSFFNELFRTKEDLAHLLGQFRRHGMLDRSQIKSLHDQFAEAFQDALKMRHRFVHSFTRHRPSEMKMLAVAAANSLGYDLVPRVGGEPAALATALREACDEYVSVFREEVDRLTAVTQIIADFLGPLLVAKEAQPEQPRGDA